MNVGFLGFFAKFMLLIIGLALLVSGGLIVIFSLFLYFEPDPTLSQMITECQVELMVYSNNLLNECVEDYSRSLSLIGPIFFLSLSFGVVLVLLSAVFLKKIKFRSKNSPRGH